MPPYTISDEALILLSECESLLRVLPCADIPLRLRKANRIRSIHSSLAIEGNTLREDEIAAVLAGKVVMAPQQQIQEAENAAETYTIFRELNPHRVGDMLRAHACMMKGLVRGAGQFRTGGEGVFDEQGRVRSHGSARRPRSLPHRAAARLAPHDSGTRLGQQCRLSLRV